MRRRLFDVSRSTVCAEDVRRWAGKGAWRATGTIGEYLMSLVELLEDWLADLCTGAKAWRHISGLRI